ncbi:SDR family oxidoreductase [Terrimonas sp. NA20]|uniref:SDR family oxidoreductase n=1 Tax=Terrimonas ginsenosidimutans TaxID=2908004 RepID=A0ABS9L072_9BACT|nr:SDR family oxidoreductase [Terrimonas ginsenosidimutans]MCG2618022.1 SDR family oxidoreductase [Terrimonas ginsenosidimutans]
MKEYILLTGASSGIGYEMAFLLAQKNKNLILVSRSHEKLNQMREELIQKYGVSVYYIVKDLTDARAATELYQDIKRQELLVTALINNAGVGHYGRFIEIEAADELKMIELNVSSVVVLTKLFAREMAEYGTGRIMNVSSLLAFLPFPYYAVYSATKAFILAFSDTVAAELEHTGVVVTALCPGPVDTGFNSEAMRTTNAFRANKPMPARAVAEQGVKLLLEGKGSKVVGFMNRLLSFLPRLVPGTIMMRVKKKLASQQK